MTEPHRHHLVGRLELDVPVSFTRLPQEVRILGSSVEELDIPDGTSQELAAESLWKQRLARATAGDTEESPFELVRNEVLPPGVRVMELKEQISEKKRRYLSEKHLLEALVIGWGRAVVIRYRWRGDRPGEPVVPEVQIEREAGIRNFYDLLGAVRFSRGSAALVARSWYYMADAALAVSHDRVAAAKEENESTRIVFEDQSRTMQIELRTEYPWSPDSEGNPGLISGFVKALTEAWTGVDVIRSDKRKVAGLEGEEVVAYERKLDALDFTWARNREKSGAQYRPRLRLDMRARGTDREVAISIWDAILGSVRILPRR